MDSTFKFYIIGFVLVIDKFYFTNFNQFLQSLTKQFQSFPAPTYFYLFVSTLINLFKNFLQIIFTHFHFLPTFSNFYQLLPIFFSLNQLLLIISKNTNFYPFLPIFTNFTHLRIFFYQQKE